MPRGRPKNPIRSPEQQAEFERLRRQRNTQNQRNRRAAQRDRALEVSRASNNNSNQLSNNVFEMNPLGPNENQNNTTVNNEESGRRRIARAEAQRRRRTAQRDEIIQTVRQIRNHEQH